MTYDELAELPENGGIEYKTYKPDRNGVVVLPNGKKIAGLTHDVQVPIMLKCRALFLENDDTFVRDEQGIMWVTGIDPATGIRYKERTGM